MVLRTLAYCNGHGRVETRRIAARDLLANTLAPFPGARQAFCVVRERTDATTGATSTETAYGITTVPAERAGPRRLFAWIRGHWQIENANHYRRDATMGEDASSVRARHAPANNATLNNIALAVVFHRGLRYLPKAHLHFMMRRRDALDAILSPASPADPTARCVASPHLPAERRVACANPRRTTPTMLRPLSAA